MSGVRTVSRSVTGIVQSPAASRMIFRFPGRAMSPKQVRPANMPSAIAAVPSPAIHALALKLS